MQEQEVARKLELCVGSFKKVLYEPDDIFLKNMEKNNLAGDDVSKYQLWEWTQGVGLYGLYNYYKLTGDRGTFDFLCGWYDARMAEGLPERVAAAPVDRPAPKTYRPAPEQPASTATPTQKAAPKKPAAKAAPKKPTTGDKVARAAGKQLGSLGKMFGSFKDEFDKASKGR